MVASKGLYYLLFISVLLGCSDAAPPSKSAIPFRFNEAPSNSVPFWISLANRYPGDVFSEGRGYTKRVALTFDDGPSMDTLLILDVLKEHQVPATFFMIGEQLEKYSDIALRALSENHHLGNHSIRHERSGKWSAKKFWEESTAPTNRIFEHKLGFSPTFFRPPFGDMSEEQVTLVTEKGMKTIFWSVDTEDWDSKSVSASDIVKTVNDGIHDEAIVLMHDGGKGRGRILHALPEIIQYYKQKHYTFVTIGELLGVEQAL